MAMGPHSMGKRLQQMNLLENTEDKEAPQSPAFYDWGTEKQKVHVSSPHSTSQVTPLPQLPPFPKIYPFPALDGHFIWPCSLVPPATSWHWTSWASVSSYTQLNPVCFILLLFPLDFAHKLKRKQENNTEKRYAFSVLDAVKTNRGLSEKPVEQFLIQFPGLSHLMHVSLNHTPQLGKSPWSWLAACFIFHTWKPTGSYLEPKSELPFCTCFSV